MHRVAIAVVALTAATLSVLAGLAVTFPGDVTLAAILQPDRRGGWDTAMVAVTTLGEWWVIGLAACTLVFLFYVLRKRSEFYAMIFSVLSSLGVVALLKEAVGRPRPAESMVWVWRDYSGPSFPSGHAALAMLFFGLLFYIAPNLTKSHWVQRAIKTSSVIIIIAIGLSRIYLGVHWPSDVVGGYLIGGLFLMLVIAFLKWRKDSECASADQ